MSKRLTAAPSAEHCTRISNFASSIELMPEKQLKNTRRSCISRACHGSAHLSTFMVRPRQKCLDCSPPNAEHEALSASKIRLNAISTRATIKERAIVVESLKGLRKVKSRAHYRYLRVQFILISECGVRFVGSDR